MAKHLARRRWTNKLRKKHPPRLYTRLWNTWTKNSDQEEPYVDWVQLEAEVCRVPRITQYRDDDRQGMLMLHLACALKPPLRVVEGILRTFPQAIGHKSTAGGLTPLHIAVGRNADPSVVRLLIQQDVQSLLVPDDNGHTVISWACRQDVSKDLMRLILTFNPSLARNRQTSMAGSPLDFIFRQRHYYKTGHDVPQWQENQWQKFMYLLWAAHYGTVVSPRNGQTLSTLHAALALSCPTSILEDATRLYAQDMSGIRDVQGNYPLHYAVRTSNASRKILKTLMKHFPNAVSIRDGQHGRLPLHEALKNGRTWEEGIKDLYRAYPAAITEADTQSSLLPAVLAAASCDDLTTIFALVREHPQAIHR